MFELERRRLIGGGTPWRFSSMRCGSMRCGSMLGVALAALACGPIVTTPAASAPVAATWGATPRVGTSIAAAPAVTIDSQLPAASAAPIDAPQSCPRLPPTDPHGFDPIEAPELISRAKRGPGEGGVCDGRAYRVMATRTIYRAYNGTNPSSRLGEWWALEQPSGSVAAYRRDYQICYQWSPLDRLVQCTLRAGATVVLGTGQSAVCSEHLRYATSGSLQLYLADARADTADCREFEAVMTWESAGATQSDPPAKTPGMGRATASARD